MSTEAIIGLVVALAGVNLAGVIGAAWTMSGRLTRIETRLETLDGMSDRVTRLEGRVDRHEEILDAAFDVVPAGQRH